MYVLEDTVLPDILADYGFNYDKELNSWFIDCYSTHIPNKPYEVRVGRFLVVDRKLYVKKFIEAHKESFDKLVSRVINELLQAKIIKEVKENEN